MTVFEMVLGFLVLCLIIDRIGQEGRRVDPLLRSEGEDNEMTALEELRQVRKEFRLNEGDRK